jgi:ankyrin repeat protein
VTHDPRDEFIHMENIIEAVQLMLKYGASVNAEGKEIVTPLHLASECARVCAMKVLLEHGAHPHVVDDYGWTSLHYAVVRDSQAAAYIIPLIERLWCRL